MSFPTHPLTAETGEFGAEFADNAEEGTIRQVLQ
jgi:hypothetical protein